MFTDDINLHGKHAQYVKDLAGLEVKLFNRNIDVYMNAALVGLIYGKKEERDRHSQYKDISTNILASAINREKVHLDYVFRLMMLLDDTEKLTLEEKINRAFRDDSNRDVSDRHKQNMDLFNSYVLGGITMLYDKIIGEGINSEDFMRNSFEFIRDRNEEVDVEIGGADRLIDAL